MVKWISRQVIVVQSPEQKLFEQAIFILKDDAHTQQGVTDDALLKEAKRLIQEHGGQKRYRYTASGPVWAAGGAGITALIWLLCVLL